MSIYHKPVRLLFKDMVEALNIKPREVIARDQVFLWFQENYPKVKDGTIAAHLLNMSTNAPSRVHYNVNLEGDDDLLYQIDSQRFRLYNPDEDPSPIYEKEIDRAQEEKEEEIEFSQEVKVRGIIIAREFSEDLLLACSQLDNIDLYEYELSVSLRPVELDD